MELTHFNKDRKKARKPTIDLSTMVYGKIPPQAKDLEDAVLGGLMLDRGAYDAIQDILKSESFYVDANQRIFNAIRSLTHKNLPVDILTVVEELKMSEELDMVGGPYYVTKLTNAVVSVANIEAHARIVQQKFIQRELIRISGEIIGDAYEDNTDVFDLLDEALMKIENVNSQIIKNDALDMISCSTNFLNELDKKINSPQTLTGVTSGFTEIDLLTHGWQPTDLIILAARPGVGKTALSINFALKAALNKFGRVPVALFNMEMSTSQLMQRIVSAVSEISFARIKRGHIEPEERKHIANIITKLEKAPIFIDDTAGLTWLELRSRARKLIRKHKIGLIIIDYLQLMSDVNDGERRNREQQVSNITRNLKKLAKETGIPIIALSQLSRAVETRSEKKGEPVLSDLRESGAIEQDADIVAFIYRPEYYDTNSLEPGETFIKFAKHRNGTLDKIKLYGKLHIQKFYDANDERLDKGKLIKTGTIFKTEDFSEGIEDTKYKF